MSGVSPQIRTRQYLQQRGYLVATVEGKKKFPDRKKQECRVCGHRPMIEISVDLWNCFDVLACKPSDGSQENADFIFVQTTSRSNHAARRNKILASMEAKLVLLSGGRILIQSWRQKEKRAPWQVFDEWITLDQFKQAPHYPNTVAGLAEIKRKEKKPDLPPGTALSFNPISDEDIPF